MRAKTSPEKAPASAPAARAPAPSAPVSTSPPAGVGVPCGEAGCLAFSTAEAAFEHVLSRAPRVLAIGEAHAQRGTEKLASTTERFATTLLPRLEGRAGDLVIELLLANGRCGKKVEKKVAEKQAPVTQNQAATAQNEFVALGHKAKALGIAPHPLIPNCEEYAAIAASGSNDIELFLQTITKVTAREVSALLARSPTSVVVIYGGALHNDATARPGRESWTFGPELSAKVSGAYVELDLIVPEYVKDTEAWRALAWYDAFARAPRAETARLFVTGPQSYALVFPSGPSQ